MSNASDIARNDESRPAVFDASTVPRPVFGKIDPNQEVFVMTFHLNHPLELLEQFAGKFVAWSPDGTRVLASADTVEGLFAVVEEKGLDPDEMVLAGLRDL